MKERIRKIMADMVSQSESDFIVRGEEDQLGVYIKTRDGGALHVMNATPIGSGFNIEITAPRAFYFGADGKLYLSSWAENYTDAA